MFTFATKLHFVIRGLTEARAPNTRPDEGDNDVTLSPDSPVPPTDGANDTYNTTFSPENLTRAEYIGYMYVIPIICITGIILNSLVILVLNRRNFRSPTYTFLCVLAFSDIVTAVFTLPGAFSRCGGCPGLVRARGWLFYEIFVFVPFTNTSECISSWMTMVLAIERLLAIKMPMVDRRAESSRKRTHVTISATVAAAVVLNLPYFFVFRVLNVYDTELTRFGGGSAFQVFSWARAVLVQFLPLLVLIILNILLIREVRLSQQRCRKMLITTKSAVREKAQLRLTLMLTGTVVMFICGNVPVALSYSVIFSAMFGADRLYSEFYSTWLVTTHSLALLSYALDFVVYCALNKYFREACAVMLSCDRKKRKVADLDTQSTSEKKIHPEKY